MLCDDVGLVDRFQSSDGVDVTKQKCDPHKHNQISLNLQETRRKQQKALQEMPGFTDEGMAARAWLAMQEDRDRGWEEVRALREELRRSVPAAELGPRIL